MPYFTPKVGILWAEGAVFSWKEDTHGGEKGERYFIYLMQKNFAAALGLSVSFISQVESGKTKPGFKFFKAIIEKYHINPVYLLTGKGDMFLDKETGAGTGMSEYGADSVNIERMFYFLKHSSQVRHALKYSDCKCSAV